MVVATVADEGSDVHVVVSLSEAGRILGVDRETVADLLRAMGLETVSHPSNARAKGVSLEQMKLLRKRLEPLTPAHGVSP